MAARDLEKDLEICEAATPGPWYDTTDRICSEVTTNPNGGPQHWICQLWFKDEENMQNYAANARFIAEAREGWPYAIHLALKLEKEIDRLRNELNILQEQLEQRGCCT